MWSLIEGLSLLARDSGTLGGGIPSTATTCADFVDDTAQIRTALGEMLAKLCRIYDDYSTLEFVDCGSSSDIPSEKRFPLGDFLECETTSADWNTQRALSM
jgi:hypothetical protein